MKHIVEKEFIEICKEIIAENKTLEEWAEIESCDAFQNGKYVGGFEAIENEFTFSFYDNGKEYWFQCSIDMIRSILEGKINEVEMRNAII